MEYFLGFLIALAVGLTGVGAGSVTAPVLMLFFHLAPVTSVGTALTFAAFIKLALLPVYIWNRQVDGRILLLLCYGGIPGVLAGVFLLSRADTRNHERLIYLLIGLTIVIVTAANLYRSFRRQSNRSLTDHSRWLPPIAIVIGSEVGFSSAGAGALGGLALLNLTQLTPARVVGTDMVFGLILSLIGGGLHFAAGHYDHAILPQLLAGGLLGSFTGAALSSAVPSRILRFVLSLWLAALGAQLCWRALT